jgi:hypothetical protein
MQQEPEISRSTSYLVPCVFKAVQMIEASREARVGLRVEDFLGMTGYSRSTIYRILRTLTACSYMVRERGGTYRLNAAVIRVAEDDPAMRAGCRPSQPSALSKDAHEQFERWGVRFGPDGRRVAALTERGREIATSNHAEI